MINLLKRFLALCLSVAILICCASCSTSRSVLDKLNDMINSAKDAVNSTPVASRQFTAQEYKFPTSIAGFESLPRSEYFGYSHLTKEQKLCYDKMYEAAMLMDRGLFYVGKCSSDDVAVAFHAMTYDCPYIIWLSSFYGMSETEDGTYVSFVDANGGYDYTMTPEERDDALDKMYEQINAFVSKNLITSMTDFEIELAAHDWLCERSVYDDAAAASLETGEDEKYVNAWTAYGAIIEGRAVCEGYAHALQLVLNYLGIPCAALRVWSDDEMHMICVVQIDGDWVYIDPTWNDKDACGLEYTHDFFNLNYDEIKVTHQIYDPWQKVKEKGQKLDSNFNIYLPESTSKEHNYYKVMGRQINSQAEFNTVVINQFKAMRVNALEFQLTYCQPTTKTIDKMLDDARFFKRLENNGLGPIGSINYAVLNNGAFCIRLNRDIYR